MPLLYKTRVRKTQYSGDVTEFAGLTKFTWITGALILFAIWFLIFCVRFVGAGEVGIITRFGNVDRVATSGLAIKAPWPFEHIVYMETRVQKAERDATAATADLQDVTGKIALNYALDNAAALNVFKTLGEDYEARVVDGAVQESFKAVTADYTAQELITKRPAVKVQAYTAIKNRLEKYGIRVVDLNIVNFSFSTAFNQSIEAVQIANQKIAQAQQELNQAKVDAEKTITQAQAAADAQRLQQQTLTPELIQKMQIESQNKAIEKWNGVLPTTNAGGANTIFNIPTGK